MSFHNSHVIKEEILKLLAVGGGHVVGPHFFTPSMGPLGMSVHMEEFKIGVGEAMTFRSIFDSEDKLFSYYEDNYFKKDWEFDQRALILVALKDALFELENLRYAESKQKPPRRIDNVSGPWRSVFFSRSFESLFHRRRPERVVRYEIGVLKQLLSKSDEELELISPYRILREKLLEHITPIAVHGPVDVRTNPMGEHYWNRVHFLVFPHKSGVTRLVLFSRNNARARKELWDTVSLEKIWAWMWPCVSEEIDDRFMISPCVTGAFWDNHRTNLLSFKNRLGANSQGFIDLETLSKINPEKLGFWTKINDARDRIDFLN